MLQCDCGNPAEYNGACSDCIDRSETETYVPTPEDEKVKIRRLEAKVRDLQEQLTNAGFQRDADLEEIRRITPEIRR